MKIIIYLTATIVIILFLSCSKATEPAKIISKFDTTAYNKMLQDTNWIEITDTNYHQPLPLLFDGESAVFNSFEQARDTFLYYLNITHDIPADTVYLYGTPPIDYIKRTLLIYYFNIGGYPKIVRTIHRNNVLKKYRFVVQVGWSGVYILRECYTAVTIPKIPGDFIVEFIHFNNFSFR